MFKFLRYLIAIFFLQPCCEILGKFYSDALPLFMQVMQLTLPQPEQYFANVYRKIHETFLTNSKIKFGYTTVKESNMTYEINTIGHW